MVRLGSVLTAWYALFLYRPFIYDKKIIIFQENVCGRIQEDAPASLASFGSSEARLMKVILLIALTSFLSFHLVTLQTYSDSTDSTLDVVIFKYIYIPV